MAATTTTTKILTVTFHVPRRSKPRISEQTNGSGVGRGSSRVMKNYFVIDALWCRIYDLCNYKILLEPGTDVMIF
jgi:hypothetical protein